MSDCFTGQFPSPPKGTSVKVTMNETSTGKVNPYKWFVQLFSIKDKSINVEISPPCNCIIGEWMFSIHTESKSKDADNKKLEYNYNEDIVILLNPWCTGIKKSIFVLKIHVPTNSFTKTNFKRCHIARDWSTL